MSSAGSSTSMNLALVIERFDPTGGGAERSTAQIAGELTRRGHRVTILTGYTEPCEPGYAVESLFNHWHIGVVSLLRFARWAPRRIARGGFDASLSVTTAVPASVLQPRSGTIRETLERNIAMRTTPAARLTKRTFVALSPKQQALLALERRTLASPRVRRIAALSQYVVDQLQRHYGVDPQRIEIIPNAAEMPRADASQREAWRQLIRKGFSIPDDAPAYLFAAHNPQLKGGNQLFQAVKLLQDRGIKVTIMLAGPTEYAQQGLAARLGIRDRIRFIGPTGHMPALYCAADVTVLPSFYDPASKVVIESLMMGTPAISTAFNGASDFLTAPDGRRRGRVIADPADIASLASAMAELADPAERARCREAAVGLEEPLSMRRHVDRLEALLREAADSTP